jgi:hypothetical protein
LRLTKSATATAITGIVAAIAAVGTVAASIEPTEITTTAVANWKTSIAVPVGTAQVRPRIAPQARPLRSSAMEKRVVQRRTLVSAAGWSRKRLERSRLMR